MALEVTTAQKNDTDLTTITVKQHDLENDISFGNDNDFRIDG